MNSSRHRRLALLEQKAISFQPATSDLRAVRRLPGRPEPKPKMAVACGTVEPGEEIEDFEKRVRADLPQRSAVPSVVIFTDGP